MRNINPDKEYIDQNGHVIFGDDTFGIDIETGEVGITLGESDGFGIFCSLDDD